MGTRSLTFVHDGDAAKPLTCMYRQYDGYPSDHGLELQQFLAPFKMVNGIGPTTDDMRIANGAGCLAAQMIAHFKDGPAVSTSTRRRRRTLGRNTSAAFTPTTRAASRSSASPSTSARTCCSKIASRPSGEFCNAKDD